MSAKPLSLVSTLVALVLIDLIKLLSASANISMSHNDSYNFKSSSINLRISSMSLGCVTLLVTRPPPLYCLVAFPLPPFP